MITHKVFNTVSLLHYTEDDRVFSAELLKMALQDMPDFLMKARICLEKDRWDDAASCIHKIKGIAGTVGADELYALCLASEKLFKKTGTVKEGEAILNSLKESIHEFCQYSAVQDWISDV